MVRRAEEGTRWRALWRTRWAELRTAATGTDPGLVRLRLATGALLSIVLALVLAIGLQRLTGEQPTVVIMAAVLAMVSNIAVNEIAVHRVRVTTALLVLPAMAAVALGTVLAPHRVIADAVFVLIMIGGVYIRRFGPRGFRHRHGRCDGVLLLAVPRRAGERSAVARPHRGHRRRFHPARARLPARRQARADPGAAGTGVPRPRPQP